MIVKELRGRFLDFSVADLVLSPSLSSSTLAFESGVGGSPAGAGVMIGGLGTIPVPSYSGKHLRLIFDGSVTQDVAHTDALFFFSLNNLPSSPVARINSAISISGDPAIQMIWDFYVPEYQDVSPSSVAPFTCLFLNSDGSVTNSLTGATVLSDSIGFSPVFNIQDGGSGLPTVTVRTRRLFLEFVD